MSLPQRFVVTRAEATIDSTHDLAEEAARHLVAWGLPERRAADLRLALAEMICNVCRHAYAGEKPGPLRLELIWSEDDITLSVAHQGVLFDPFSVKEPPEPDPEDPSTWPEGGMGLMLIRQLTDFIEYYRSGGWIIFSAIVCEPLHQPVSSASDGHDDVS